MNKEILKKSGIIAGSVIIGIYALFLILPLFLNGIANSCGHYLTKVIEDASGFKVKFENVKFVTTPKLTVGAKIGHLSAALPNNDIFLTLDNAQGKLSLIPILAGRIEIDIVGADDISANLKVKKDGKFLIEDYIPESQPETMEETAKPVTGLPFGMKLSNHLPDIRVKNYKIAFTDISTDKQYFIHGESFNITDFIINKKVKVSTNGKIVLDDKTPFNYDVKVFNKIMPETSLNDLVFAPQTQEEQEPAAPVQINIIDIFKTIYNNQITANLKTDISTDGSLDNIDLRGLINIDKLSIAVDGKPLPDGHISINMKGKNIDINSAVYTAKDEETSLKGFVKTGKKPHVNLTCKSNAGINNIFNILDNLAKSVNYKELDTLSAKGAIDANFTINADTKKVTSSGYFKIPQASVRYGLLDVLIDKIIADIDFSNNMVNIKKLGFSILNQPLNVYGTLKQDTSIDLHLIADKLSVKGLITAAGQAALLKDNDVASGVLSMDAAVTGNLKQIKPILNLSLDNLNIINKPLNIAVKLPKARVTVDEKDLNITDTYLTLDNSRVDIAGKVSDYLTKKLAIDITAQGGLLASDLHTMLPADIRKDIKASGKLPIYVKITGNDKTQNILAQILATPSNYLNIANVDQLNGKSTLITSTMKIANDSLKLSDTGVFAISGLSTVPTTNISGNLLTVTGSVDKLASKQILNNITIKTPSNLDFAIPGFAKSKVKGAANITINGTAVNPVIGGTVSIPSINIPEVLVEIGTINLDFGNSKAKSGYLIPTGKGTVAKFKSGGIEATDLSSNFSLTYDTLYLNGIKGNAFDGKVNGDVSVNLMNGKTNVDFHGNSMNAEKAVEGAAGLKNALSGTLGFNAKLSLNAYAPSESAMMQSLNGNVNFDIKNGTFGNIGRLENLLFAENLRSNGVIAAALTPVTNMPVVKNTAIFKLISGDMNLNNGWADIKSIKTSGPSMAYFIYGKYNLLNATANITILGRLGADVVAALGPIGQLSVSKLTSYIPKFGALTGNLINALTTNPQGERTSEIPELSDGNKEHQDFKVSFNGGVESKSSVKSFKWLSVCDTSEIEGGSLKDQLKQSADAIKQLQTQRKEDVQKSVEEARNAAKQTAEDLKNQVQNTKDSINELKNLFKKPAAGPATEAETTAPAP